MIRHTWVAINRESAVRRKLDPLKQHSIPVLSYCSGQIISHLITSLGRVCL